MKEFQKHYFKIDGYAADIKEICSSRNSLARKRRDNFWTIGMSTYKDGYNNLNVSEVKYNNEVLKSFFPMLYKDQLEVVEKIMGAPVTYMKNMPLPGFHVFKYCKEFEEALARPHVDVPFNKYDWGSEIAHNDIFTHVIPVEIPDNAGLNVWYMSAMDMHKYTAERIVMKARIMDPDVFIPYEPNMMVMHTGKWVHQIKPFDKETKKWRITLQSHSVFKDGSWQLYW